MRGTMEEAGDELMGRLGQSRTLLSRMCGEVRRYHCWHVNREQTVADHTFHVLRIYAELFGPPESAVTTFVLLHDMEMLTGDVQHPAKRLMPALKEACDAGEAEVLRRLGRVMPELTHVEAWRVKAADLLEMYEFGTRECMSGNEGTGETVRRRIRDALDAHWGSLRLDTVIYDQAIGDWARVMEHGHSVDLWLDQERRRR